MTFPKLLCMTMAATVSLTALAFTPAVRDIDIHVLIRDNGTASITERWDVTVASGTEWYLVRDNLGDIAITGLKVSENGIPYVNEGKWDTDRSIREKAGRCGIVPKNDGCEICWGVGSYGDHVFTVSYNMVNVAKSLDDCDIFHVQLISPGLSSPPLHARAEISIETAAADSSSVRIWGFGFYGHTAITPSGTVILESSEPFAGKSSMIALLKLNKGMIHPVSVRHASFEEVSRKAFRGSDYKDNDGTSFLEALNAFIFGILLPMMVIYIPIRLRRKAISDVLGTKRKKDVRWSREIPYGGDLAATDYILGKLAERRSGNNIASAIVLRMLQKGCLSIRKDQKGRTEIMFGNEEELNGFGEAERKLWAFMKEASGSDEILQNREFSKWSARHTEEINDWLTDLSIEGEHNINAAGYRIRGKYTPEGQAQARTALGLKKFLSDFTLIRERATMEATLWQDYLVFGAMFGIADKVAAELRDIDPTRFKEATMYDYTTTRGILDMSSSLARSITNAKMSYDRKQMSSGSVGGLGGGTSFRGGGGFSGGGFGGGSR